MEKVIYKILKTKIELHIHAYCTAGITTVVDELICE